MVPCFPAPPDGLLHQLLAARQIVPRFHVKHFQYVKHFQLLLMLAILRARLALLGALPRLVVLPVFRQPLKMLWAALAQPCCLLLGCTILPVPALDTLAGNRPLLL